jgi:hypothetical protein
MVQRATGSLDAIAMAQRGTDSRPGAVSMSLSGIVKRHKRTLMFFVNKFLVPSLQKIMWRNMQYYPERYVPMNFSFVASNTMGIMQREYETQQLIQLLQTMQPGTPEYRVTLIGIVANTGLTNRTQLQEVIEQAIQTDMQAQQMALEQQNAAAADPLQQQLSQVGIELQIAEKRAQIAKLQAETALAQAKARQAYLQPALDARELSMKGVYNSPEEQMAAEFDRRMKIGDQMLKEQDIQSNERIARMQVEGSVRTAELDAMSTVAAAKKSEPQQVPVPTPVPVPVRQPVPVPVPKPVFLGRRVVGPPNPMGNRPLR